MVVTGVPKRRCHAGTPHRKRLRQETASKRPDCGNVKTAQRCAAPSPKHSNWYPPLPSASTDAHAHAHAHTHCTIDVCSLLVPCLSLFALLIPPLGLSVDSCCRVDVSRPVRFNPPRPGRRGKAEQWYAAHNTAAYKGYTLLTRHYRMLGQIAAGMRFFSQ